MLTGFSWMMQRFGNTPQLKFHLVLSFRIPLEWDDAKSDACFTYCGFDFAYALRVVNRDRRWDYGEDRYRLLGATEADLASQQHQDDAEAMRDVARFARRARRRLGLTQMEFARRIDVPHETIRNWEQGKRRPTGAAKALLRVLDKAPETALRVLT